MSPFSTAKLTRRAALSLALAGVARAAVAVPPESSPIPKPRPEGFAKRAIPSGEALVAAAGVSGVVAYGLAPVRGGPLLEARSADTALPPASVAKVLTALYGLETLGDDFRFATRVLATGPVVDGIVQGDLVLAGGGDPTLDTDMLGALAADVKAAGVTGVTGRFLVWDGALPRIEEIDGQQTEYAGYNPTVSGLNLNFNRVHFEWKKAGADYTLKVDARAELFAPDVKVARVRIAERDLPVFDHEAGAGRDEWTVARPALGGGGSRWLPVRLPALYGAEVFATLCAMQGVRIGAAERIATMPEGVEIARHESAPLVLIVQDMLKYSTNLTAEVVGLTASAHRGGRVEVLAASARRMSAWARVRFGIQDVSFVDHSGLGGLSNVSVNDMLRVLTTEGVEARLAPLLKPIPVRPDDGKAEVVPAVEVVAKTGTLDFVSNLAGYVTASGGQRMAFVVFAADLPARAAAKASGAEVPVGARTFNSRAKALHHALLRRWGAFYAG